MNFKNFSKEQKKNLDIIQRIANSKISFRLYVFTHDGYGDIRVEMRILRRGHKEVSVHCGKQHRYVCEQTSFSGG